MSTHDLYVDDPNAGPRRETSHPNFVAACSADFYFDGDSMFGPFGNRAGRTELVELEGWYGEHGPAARLAERTFAEWADLIGCATEDAFTVLGMGDPLRFAHMTGQREVATVADYDYTDEQVLVSRTLGQLKITGRMEPLMRTVGLAALSRLAIVAGDDEEWSTVITQMGHDLQAVESG